MKYYLIYTRKQDGSLHYGSYNTFDELKKYFILFTEDGEYEDIKMMREISIESHLEERIAKIEEKIGL